MSSKLTIWCNADLSPDAVRELCDGTLGHELLISKERTSNLGSTGPDSELARSEIAFGQPDPTQVVGLEGLKWVHLTSAGYTRYDTDPVRVALKTRGAIMTNSSSVYDEPCAQHLLAFMLAIARQLPGCLADQQSARSWAYGAHRPATRILKSDTVLILGYGAIGRRLAELLSPFGVSVIGVRRVVRGDESIPTYPLTHLEALLPKADHVVNILPANPSTNGLIGPSFLGQVKPGALFYNVGRGTTVDQMALISALESGQLGGAYLDVTDPEPLPSDHPLWTCRNCYITPHIAGGRQAEDSTLVSHFLDNLRRYLATEPLTDRII